MALDLDCRFAVPETAPSPPRRSVYLKSFLCLFCKIIFLAFFNFLVSIIFLFFLLSKITKWTVFKSALFFIDQPRAPEDGRPTARS